MRLLFAYLGLAFLAATSARATEPPCVDRMSFDELQAYSECLFADDCNHRAKWPAYAARSDFTRKQANSVICSVLTGPATGRPYEDMISDLSRIIRYCETNKDEAERTMEVAVLTGLNRKTLATDTRQFKRRNGNIFAGPRADRALRDCN